MADRDDERLTALGRRLAAARRACGLTQRELAARVGVSRPSIANIEAGRQGVDVLLVVDAAAVLGLDLGALFDTSFDIEAYQAGLRKRLVAEVDAALRAALTQFEEGAGLPLEDTE